MSQLPGEHRHNTVAHAGLIVLLLLAVGHVWAVWGQPGLPWGDYGVWLHTVERLASGERPYLDFYAVYPPVTYWFLGLLSRIGTSLPVIWTSMSLLFVGIVVAYWYVGRLLLPRAEGSLLLIGGLILAMTYGNIGSAPIPMGMYTPAAPLAGFLMLCGVAAAISFIRHPSLRGGILVGGLAVVAVFTKHDTWIPSAFLVVASSVLVTRAHPEISMRTRMSPLMTAAVAGVSGIGLVILLYGAEGFARSAFAPGQAGANAGRGLPTFERLVLQTVTASAILVFVTTTAWFLGKRNPRTRNWMLALGVVLVAASTIYLVVTYRIAMRVRAGEIDALTTATEDFFAGRTDTMARTFRFVVIRFRDQLREHALPLLLLPVTIGWAWTQRSRLAPDTRNVLVLILGYALAARARRQFEYTEWFQVLLEVPAYTLILSVWLDGRGGQRRVMAVAGAALIAVSAYLYPQIARGRFTDRNAEAIAQTAQGAMRTDANFARDVAWLRNALTALDPSGNQPLVMKGYAAGFNYYVGRRTGTSLMIGFRLSNIPIDSGVTLTRTLDPPALFLDNRAFDNLKIGRFRWFRWEYEPVPSPFAEVDAPLFDELVDGCEVVARSADTSDGSFYRVIDCEATNP